MVSLPQFRYLTRSMLVSIVLLIMLILVSTGAYGVSYTYTINSDSTTDTSQNSHYYLYIPSSLTSGTYICRNYSNYINAASSLNVKSYPVLVKYVYQLGNPEDDGVNSAASLSLSRCSSSGVVNSSTTTIKTIGQGETFTGTTTINSNEGLLFDFYTGQWYWRTWYGDHQNRAFTGTVQISFQFDETAPDAPVLNVKNIGEAGVVKQGAKIYAKNPVVLQWATPADNATVLADQTKIGPGKIVKYKLNIYKNKTLIDSESITENASGNTFPVDLPEGEYLLKLQAYDEDSNESLESNSIDLVVDRSVDAVALTNDGVKIDGNNLKATWKPVVDQSDIQEYQVALTTSKETPGEGQIATAEAHAIFTDLVLTKSYFVWVRAIDRIGNVGQWTVSGPFNQSGKAFSVTAFPEATLDANNKPQYKVKIQINTLLDADDLILIERKLVGAPSGEDVVELSYSKLAEQGFQVVDRTGLVKHGQYIYYVTDQSRAITYQCAPVTIPNIATMANLSTRPADGATTTGFRHEFDISSDTDYEGDTLKMKVWYRQKGGELKSSGAFEYPAIDVTFPKPGEWEWWIEVGEFDGDKLVGKHMATAAQTLFVRDSTAYLSDGTLVAKGQPRYENSAPGFGKAILIEGGRNTIPNNPFFTNGIDEWIFNAAPGTVATIESIIGGNYGDKNAKITINKSGTLGNKIQLYKSLCSLNTSPKKSISCQIRIRSSSPTNNAIIKCCNDNNPNINYGNQILNLSTEYQVFQFSAIAPYDPTTKARICLDLGNIPSGTVLEIDYICCEEKPYSTSPYEGERYTDQLKISTSGMSPISGTFEELIYVSNFKNMITPWSTYIFRIFDGLYGNSGMYVYHYSSNWRIVIFDDDIDYQAVCIINDKVTNLNQWYRFRITWSLAEVKLQIFEVSSGIKVAEGAISSPHLPSSFEPNFYLGGSFLNDDLRISNIARTDTPDYTKPLPVDEYTVLKMNFDGTLEPEYCQPTKQNFTIAASTTTGVSLPAYFETNPGKALQLAATVNITSTQYSWTPGDGGATFTGATPSYTYTKTVALIVPL